MTKTIENKGFSLLEITIVLIIISVLLSAVIPVMSRSYLEKAAQKTALEMSNIQNTSQKYYIDNGNWPDIAALQSAVPYYLPPSWNNVNPFGYPYNISSNNNQLTVSTTVSPDAMPIIQNLLPNSSTGDNNTISFSSAVPGAISGLGSWQSKNFNTAYPAVTDGFLVGGVYLRAGVSGTQSSTAQFYTSSNESSLTSNPTATVDIQNYVAPGQTTSGIFPFCFPVRKGDYYELALTGGYESGASLYFLPLGA